jgi:DUF4097 and DUF4098 domain-containing protein YvlB
MANELLTDVLSEPLQGVSRARIDINSGSGNLAVDALPNGDEVLARGELQYFEKQGRPTRCMESADGEATFQLNGKDACRPWLHLPWAACNGATEWHIHLNPSVSSDISARSGGGNVKLELRQISATRRLSADTGGGNIEIVFPDNAADLTADVRTGTGNVAVEFGRRATGNSTVHASSGAGNVTVRLPRSVAARIHASTGMGKVDVESAFGKIDAHTYQSPGYDDAATKVEITASSGAGNVKVEVLA